MEMWNGSSPFKSSPMTYDPISESSSTLPSTSGPRKLNFSNPKPPPKPRVTFDLKKVQPVKSDADIKRDSKTALQMMLGSSTNDDIR